MTAAEAAPWLASLKQITGFEWTHRVDHKARDEFKAIYRSFELHLWSNGRWALYEDGLVWLLSPAPRPFQEALTQLGTEFNKRRSQ